MKISPTWNLPHYFFKSLKDPRIDADIKTWLPITQKFAKRYKGKIRKFKTAKEVLEYYEYNEKLSMVGKKVMHYLSYLSALDTQDTEVQKKIGELEFLGIKLAELTLFVSQEWRELGAKKIREFAKSPLLKPYRNALIHEANTVQYILDEPVELALTKKSRALGIFGLHEELRNSFMFPWSEEAPLSRGDVGKTGGFSVSKSNPLVFDHPPSQGGIGTRMLTEEEIRAYAKHPNRDLRKQASESMQGVYLVHQNQITFGNLYTGIVKNWVSSCDIRGYKTVMSRRNIGEQLPDAVVDTLMTEVQKFYPLYQRFLRAKHKHLRSLASLGRGATEGRGVAIESGKKNLTKTGNKDAFLNYDQFYGYDVHAPLFPIEKKIPYGEATKMVIDMFDTFDKRFGEYARDMIQKGRIDVYPKPGKKGGAFASYDKDLESFVLLNYTDTVDDVFTLAHELGHAIHGHLAQIQKSPVYDAPLVLAETASIFSESLLMKRIQKTLSKQEQLELLNQKLMDIFGSIHRQIMYVSFERRVHEHIHKGGELTYKELNIWWDEESKKLSGSAITPILPPEKNYSWSAIPHIFSTPFYCYAYSFGMLVSLALVQKYEKEGNKMIGDYIKLLSSGGSVPPVEILQSIGIDVMRPGFYKNAFILIENLLREFES